MFGRTQDDPLAQGSDDRTLSESASDSTERAPPEVRAPARTAFRFRPSETRPSPPVTDLTSPPPEEVILDEEAATEPGSASEVEEEDDLFDLHNVGEAHAFDARLLDIHRLALLRTVHTGATDVAEQFSYVRRKVDARAKELEDAIAKHEMAMQRLKAAFHATTLHELNEIMAAGWTRTGSLGFVDLRELLKPFVESRRHYPYAVWHPGLQLQPPAVLAIPRRRRRRPRRPLLQRPLPPVIQPQQVGSPCTAFLVPAPRRLGAKVPVTDEEPPSSVETSAPPTPTVSAAAGTVLDRSNITTFVKLGVNPKAPFVPKPEEREEETTEIEEKSIDSEDRDLIEETVHRIRGPTLWGFPVEGPLGWLLRIPVEPTSHYKEKIRRILEQYFRDLKWYRRCSVRTLPGGLSPITLRPPPPPKYPKGGLISPEESSVSSLEETVSDVVSELGETEPEMDFAALFRPSEERHEAVGVDKEATAPPVKHVPRRLPSEIYTTTFEIGIPSRVPRVVAELEQAIYPKPTGEQAPEAAQPGPTEPPAPAGIWSICDCDICRWKREPVHIYIDEAETITQPPARTPVGEVTEFWQLADDKGEPTWIFRGRIVTELPAVTGRP